MPTPQQWLQEILAASESLLNDEAFNHQQVTFVKSIHSNAQIVQNQLVSIPNNQTAFRHIFAKISHEFHTPQTPIIAYSKMLIENPEQFGAHHLSDSQRQSLTLIHDCATKLWNWTQSIIDSAQLERQQMHKAAAQPTNLNQLLENYIPLYQYFLKEYPVEVFAEIPQNLPLVMANSYHLSHLIQHIILTIASELIDKGEIHLSTSIEVDFVALNISCPVLQLTSEAIETLFQKQGRHIYRQHLEEQGGHIHLASPSKIALYLAIS
jgi:signal transduction histidine kinase